MRRCPRLSTRAITLAVHPVHPSGFVGRYLLVQVSGELRDRLAALDRLRREFDGVSTDLARTPAARAGLRIFTGFFSRLAGSLLTHGDAVTSPAGRLAPAGVLALVGALADEEYAAATHARFKKLFSRWLRVHIVLSGVLYLLLGLHIWAGLRFGLRWWP